MIVRTLLCVLSACMVTLHANADSVIGTRVEATWRVQSLVFHHSSSVAYSCAALREKIAAILETVGAHRGTVVAMECGGGLLRSARAHITLASPVVATSETALVPAGFIARAELDRKNPRRARTDRSCNRAVSGDVAQSLVTSRRLVSYGRLRARARGGEASPAATLDASSTHAAVHRRSDTRNAARGRRAGARSRCGLVVSVAGEEHRHGLAAAGTRTDLATRDAAGVGHAQALLGAGFRRWR